MLHSIGVASEIFVSDNVEEQEKIIFLVAFEQIIIE